MATSTKTTWRSGVCTRLAVACILLAAATVSEAPRAASVASQARSHPELVRLTWQYGRLQALCDAMARNILDSVSQHPDIRRMQLDEQKRLIRRYEQFATANRFESRLRAKLVNESPAALRAMIALAESAIGQRASQEESEFQPTAPADLHRYRQQLENLSDGAARIHAIRRLDTAIGVTEMALTVAGASLYVSQVLPGRPDGTDYSPSANAAIADGVEAFILKMRPTQQQQVESTYLYLYRNLSLTELRSYVARYEAEPLRSLQRRLIQALGAEMTAIQSDVTNATVASRLSTVRSMPPIDI